MASVDIRAEVEQNYECFYDFIDMMVFEVAKYLKAYLPLSSPDGVPLGDIRVLNRDVFELSEKYLKHRCSMDPKKINYEKMVSHIITSYKDCLTKKDESGAQLKFIEEDLMDVITDTARKEIYN